MKHVLTEYFVRLYKNCEDWSETKGLNSSVMNSSQTVSEYSSTFSRRDVGAFLNDQIKLMDLIG